MDEQRLEDNALQPTGDRADTLYQQSLLHFQSGRWQKAIAGFEEVLQLRPDHGAAKAFLEETRLKASLDEDKPQPKRMGFPGAVKRLFLVLLAVASIVLLVVGARWAYSHWIEPQRVTQQAQKLETRQVEQAFKYLADRDYTAAQQAFRALLVEDPDNQQLQGGLAEAQAKIALAESHAKAEAAISAQDWSEAGRLLAAIIAQDPQYAEAKLAYVQEQQNLSTVLDKAEKAYLAGDWEQAIASYQALRSSNADYQKETVTGHLFESYLKQGAHLVRSNNGSSSAMHEAKSLLEKALTLRPQQPQAMQESALIDKYLEGQMQLANGDLKAAQTALEWVCEQQPDYAGGNAAVLLRISKGEPPVAPTPTPPAEVAPQPTPAAPVTPESEFQRQYASALQQGDGAFGAGDYAQAEAAYRQATAVAIHGGSDAARWLFVAYVKLGTTYAKRGNNEAAVPAIKTAIAVMTLSATAIPSTTYAEYVERGDSFAQSKDYANAFAEYDKAIHAIGRKCNCGLENWSVVP